MSRAGPAYCESVLLHYEAEIEAEAYFDALAPAASDPGKAEKLRRLAAVERHAAGAIAPLLARYGLRAADRQVLLEKGKAEARGALFWETMIAGMRFTYPGHIAAMEELEAMSPADDGAQLTSYTEHERAALAFLDLEAKGAPKGAAPLRRNLTVSLDAAGGDRGR